MIYEPMANFKKTTKPTRVSNAKTTPSQTNRKLISKLLPDALVTIKEAADDGQPWALKLIADKTLAAPKPISESIDSGVVANGKLSERSLSVVTAALNGQLSPTIAAELLGSIGHHVKLVESLDLLNRIELLENAQKTGYESK